MKNNYMGIFSSYSPGRGQIDVLIMHGVFTIEELYKTSKILYEWMENHDGKHSRS